MAANVCDNVRLQQLQDCLYYRVQEKGNCSRGCILMGNGFIFGVGNIFFGGGWGGVGGRGWGLKHMPTNKVGERSLPTVPHK